MLSNTFFGWKPCFTVGVTHESYWYIVFLARNFLIIHFSIPVMTLLRKCTKLYIDRNEVAHDRFKFSHSIYGQSISQALKRIPFPLNVRILLKMTNKCLNHSSQVLYDMLSQLTLNIVSPTTKEVHNVSHFRD